MEELVDAANSQKLATSVRTMTLNIQSKSKWDDSEVLEEPNVKPHFLNKQNVLYKMLFFSQVFQMQLPILVTFHHKSLNTKAKFLNLPKQV